ncbi:Ada metal-binding domain-containing protein [Paracoccus sp. ME4]|uniref:sunset domain-containing protein n=1 Tax=Paracoccus sp. ME4 TaxID=3138066 RepID=UPI00398B8300
MRITEIITAVALLIPAGSFLAAPAHAIETYVGSWNALHLGWNNGKDYAAAAKVAASFDLVALQEVMSVEGLEQLEQSVEALTGESWSTMASAAIGRGSYREHYAFLWRDAQVSWVDGALVYLDDRDAFSREPFSARFETVDGYQLVLASVHLIYGETVEGREFEAEALAGYKSWLEDSFPETPIFIAGDFNLPPSNPAWASVGVNSAPLITEGATTLSKSDGRFANLYDNIWAPAGVSLPITGSGIHDFPAALKMTHEDARDRVSDHAPVFMVLDPEANFVTLAPHFQGTQRAVLADAREPAGAPDQQIIRGNRNSKIYHRPDCPSYDAVSERNVEIFATEVDAASAGYRLAGNCPA